MFRCNLTRSLLQRATTLQKTQSLHPAQLPYHRTLSTTTSLRAQKDAQDKDSLKPRSTEYSKSGGDDAAAHSDTAFDPSKTKPEHEEASADKEAGGPSALNVSPGNKEASKPNDPNAGGADHGVRTKASGPGSPNKSGGGASG